MLRGVDQCERVQNGHARSGGAHENRVEIEFDDVSTFAHNVGGKLHQKRDESIDIRSGTAASTAEQRVEVGLGDHLPQFVCAEGQHAKDVAAEDLDVDPAQAE